MSDVASRSAGVLLHVTSLPGPDGAGDYGKVARDFVTWLATAGQSVWQVLPLHPPANSAMSPYDASSACAGNPLLLSLDELVADGLLTRADVKDARDAATVRAARADQPPMIAGRAGGADVLNDLASWKLPLVRQAAEQLMQLTVDSELHREFDAFCERHERWLEPWCAFSALRTRHRGAPRSDWPDTDRIRREAPPTHPDARDRLLHDSVAAEQFLVERQLTQLHAHARRSGVRIMGDLPIYVSDDSADVWANPHLFELDEHGLASALTGAPPDPFDPGGQIWPMPPYNWQANRDEGYAWWMLRIAREFDAADVVRIDHFRGFADWWRVPVGADSAAAGEWRPGPGTAFFTHVADQLGDVSFIVEDLGQETEALDALRAASGLPEMRVLVQGFAEPPGGMHRPESWSNTVAAYTATHDFNTVRGWASDADDEQRRGAVAMTGAESVDVLPAAAIECVMRSPAAYAIVPLQDWLGLGSDARMNVPGTAVGNWQWIAPSDAFTAPLAERMRRVAIESGRCARD